MIEHEFFRELYKNCSQGKINIRPIPEANGMHPVNFFVEGGAENELEAICEKYSTWNLYYGVALRNGGGKKDDITEIPALWADFDFKDFESDDPESEIRKNLSGFALETSAIIHSGGGLHAYWFLEKPLDKSYIGAVEGVLEALAAKFRSDPNAIDASRLLRIPGTKNRKPGRNDAECKVLEFRPDRRYTLGDFEDAYSMQATQKALACIEPEDDILWPTIRPEAFHGIIGEFTKLSCRDSEVDPIAVLMTLISATGVELGSDKYIKVLEDRHPPRIFTLLAGATARGGKGLSLGIVKELINCIQAMPYDFNFEPARLTQMSLSSGEGIIYQIRDPVYKIKPPSKAEIKEAEKEGREKPEPKEELEDPGVRDKRLTIVNTEFKGAFQAMNRKDNTLNSTIIQLWDARDCDEVGNMIKNEQSVATGPHVSIIGHVQTSVLKRHVEQNQDSTETGFINRFLIPCVRRQGYYSNPKPIETALKNQYAKLFLDAFTAARKISGEVPQTQEAVEYFDSIYRQIESGYGERLDEILARGAAYVKRLALVFCIMDGESAVDRRHMEAGKAIWDYCVESARFIFGDKEHSEEKTLLKALAEKPLSKSEIYSLFPNPGKEKIDSIIQRCMGTGRIELHKIKTGGRTRNVYRIIPN